MIKFIVRWAFRFLILAIVVLIGLFLLKNEIARSFAETEVRRATGLETRIGALSFSVTRPVVSIQNFTIYNNSEFGGGVFLDMPDLHLEMDGGGKPGELKFKLARVNVREFNIVESRAGRTNIVDFMGALEGSQGPAMTNRDGRIFKGIDTLNLTVGKVRYVSLRDPRKNQEIPAGLNNDVVLNVRSWGDVGGVIFKVLLRGGFTLHLDPRMPAPASPPK